jgi:hypothetical protein
MLDRYPERSKAAYATYRSSVFNLCRDFGFTSGEQFTAFQSDLGKFKGLGRHIATRKEKVPVFQRGRIR